SQEKFNVTSYGAKTVAIITMEVLAGMWINAFIVSVLCISWVKKKTLNSTDKILLLLGCSRFCYLCVSWVYSFFSIIFPKYLYVHSTVQLVGSIQSFFSFSNMWVSACLCIFYCLKIANFRNSYFIYLKLKIDRIVPGLIFGSVVFALIISIIFYTVIDKALCKNLNCTSQGRFWRARIRIEEDFFPIYFFTGFLFAISFVAVIFSALLILFSLWRHKQNMQTNSMKDLSMDAHIKAMKSILSFLIMYSINFLFIIFNLIYSLKGQYLEMFPIYVVQYIFPGVHSLVLIFINPKLEKILRRILPCGNCK
ncbi:TA2R9 protein, partial [Neodrepanis coruscans]|nr:TA2R9 protein [Neodrepanis coruscans]